MLPVVRSPLSVAAKTEGRRQRTWGRELKVGGAALRASRLEAEGYLALTPRRLPLGGTEACPAGEAGTGADLFFYSMPSALCSMPEA